MNTCHELAALVHAAGRNATFAARTLELGDPERRDQERQHLVAVFDDLAESAQVLAAELLHEPVLDPEGLAAALQAWQRCASHGFHLATRCALANLAGES